jgi:hypothetical protein
MSKLLETAQAWRMSRTKKIQPMLKLAENRCKGIPSARGGTTTDEGEEEATGDAAAGEGLDSSVDTVLGARMCEGGAVPFEGWAERDMNCTDPEANDFASGLDSGFKSILRLNTEGWGVSLARSNKASATSTSSETVGGDTCHQDITTQHEFFELTRGTANHNANCFSTPFPNFS